MRRCQMKEEGAKEDEDDRGFVMKTERKKQK